MSLEKILVLNDKSIQIEKERIAITTKIFAKENMVRQYQILGLPYRVDLCFIAHKLEIEIDTTRQKLIENLVLLLLELILILIMKTFSKENMVRQYQILGPPYRVDFCFIAHKLVIEIDETRQKLIENLVLLLLELFDFI